MMGTPGAGRMGVPTILLHFGAAAGTTSRLQNFRRFLKEMAQYLALCEIAE